MRVMGAEQEEPNWDTQKKLLCWRVLSTIINLLPHVEVVKGAAVELERHAADIMEHDVGADHVGHVGECPRCLLRDTGNNIIEDLEARDQNKMDGPCSFGVCPVGVEVWERSLVADLLKSLRRFVVDLEDTA